MADNRLDVDLNVKGNAKREVKQTQKAVKDFGSTAKKSFLDASQAFNVFVGGLGAIGVAKAFEGLSSAASGLFNTFLEGVQAAQVQEDSVNKLNTALALTGELSAETSNDFQEFSSQLQKTSTIGDEVVLSQLALAKSFGASNEQTKQLVKSAIDLASATGITVDSAVINLGKTLGGLTGELGEVVPALKNLTAEQLKAGEAIEFVAQRFGGAAQAEIATFSGAVAQNSNVFGDLQEKVGATITQNDQVIAVIKEASRTFSELGDVVSENEDELKSLVTDGLLAIVDTIPVVIQSVGGLISSLSEVRKVSAAVAGSLAEVFGQTDFAEAQAQAFAEEQKIQQEREALFNKIGSKAQEIADRIRSAAKNAENSQGDFNKSLLATNDAALEAAQGTRKLTQEEKKLQDQAKSLIETIEQKSTSREDQIEKDLEILDEAFEQRLIKEKEFNEARNELKQEQETIETQRLESEADRLLQQNERLRTIQDGFNQQEVAENARKLDEILQDERLSAAKRREIQKKLTAFQVQQNNERLQATSTFFSGFAALARQGGEETFRAFKALSTASAIIDGIAAVQKTLASVPFPFNVIAAAGIAAKTAANVSAIQSQNLQSGIDEVPPGFPNDTFRANLTSGERVVPAETNKDLKGFLSEQVGVKDLLASINNKLSMSLNRPMSIQIDGREVFRAIQEQQEAGRSLA